MKPSAGCKVCGVAIQQEPGVGRAKLYCVGCRASSKKAGRSCKRCGAAIQQNPGVGRAKHHCDACRTPSGRAMQVPRAACYEKACPWCEVLFKTPRKDQRFCSISHAHKMLNWLARPSHVCANPACPLDGGIFKARKSLYTTYCSRECAFAHGTEVSRAAAEIARAAAIDARTKTCCVCLRTFLGKQCDQVVCSDHCREQHARDVAIQAYVPSAVLRTASEDYARRSGWPLCLMPSSVRILNVLAALGLPVSRRDLASQLGITVAHVKSLTRHLRHQGLVVCLDRSLWTLSLFALSLLEERAHDERESA